MKRLILLRHAARVDKRDDGQKERLDTSSWLANYDPPLDMDLAHQQMAEVGDFVIGSDQDEVIIHSSPYNRCIQTAELLVQATGWKNKLRIDQASSEWLSDSFNLKFLPPNDDGISLLGNINQYMYQVKSPLNRDMSWDSYQFGHAGEYGEQYDVFKQRCLKYLNHLLNFYENSDKVVVVVTHGAVLSILIQIILNKPFFQEFPLCKPVELTKLNQNLFQINSSRIDFLENFNSSVHRLKDLRLPVEYETNMFIDHGGDSDYEHLEDPDNSDSDADADEGITFNAGRRRSNTTGSMFSFKKRTTLAPSPSETNFNMLKHKFLTEEPLSPTQQTTTAPLVHADVIDRSSDEEDVLLNFGNKSSNSSSPSVPKLEAALLKPNGSDEKKTLQKVLFNPNSNNNLYSINEEDDYWLGFNR